MVTCRTLGYMVLDTHTHTHTATEYILYYITNLLLKCSLQRNKFNVFNNELSFSIFHSLFVSFFKKGTQQESILHDAIKSVRRKKKLILSNKDLFRRNKN